MMKNLIKKMLTPAALALVLACCFAVSAFAELVPTNKSWSVSFTSQKKMVSDFKTSEMDDQVYGLQPGDYTDIVLNLKNEYDETVDWYMTNKVLKSLEDTRENDSGLAGGAYTYILTFKNTTTGTEKVLFSSDTVGGESVSAAGEGLHEATGALEDWLYLDTFKKGEGGTLTLRVALDGETQGNDYQDTLAELQMNFAVELNNTSTTPPKKEEEKEKPKDEEEKKKSSSSSSSSRSSSSSSSGSTVVRTGDYTDTIPYIIAAGVSGVAVLLLAIYSLRERRKQEGGRT